MRSHWRLAAVAGLLALALLLGGCGRKTMPVPPQEVEPARTSALRYQLEAQGATILWTAPARTVAGGKLPVGQRL
jgi:PBP1b-binding outer membrane lipoprotein LpoB